MLSSSLVWSFWRVSVALGLVHRLRGYPGCPGIPGDLTRHASIWQRWINRRQKTSIGGVEDGQVILSSRQFCTTGLSTSTRKHSGNIRLQRCENKFPGRVSRQHGVLVNKKIYVVLMQTILRSSRQFWCYVPKWPSIFPEQDLSIPSFYAEFVTLLSRSA